MRTHMRLPPRRAKPTPSRHSGAMRSIEPGIHNPHPWLWIPGLRQAAHPRCAIAHRGMTVVGVFLPLPHPSLRTQRSNPPSLRMCHGLLRFARNDEQRALLHCTIVAISVNRTALFQHDPRRCVIAGAFFGSDLAIDARTDQARRDCRAEEKVVEPEPCIACPSVSLVVPEREH